MTTEITDEHIKLVEEINNASIGDKFAFLHKLFTDSVRFKWHDEIYQTDGNPVEITNLQYLEILGKLLKEFSENDGKMRP